MGATLAVLVGQNGQLHEQPLQVAPMDGLHESVEWAADAVATSAKDAIGGVTSFARRHPVATGAVMSALVGIGAAQLAPSAVDSLGRPIVSAAEVGARDAAILTTPIIDAGREVAYDALHLYKTKNWVIGGVVLGGAAGAGILAEYIYDHVGFSIKAGVEVHTAQPAKVTGAYDQTSTVVKETFDLRCKVDLEGAVGLYGKSDGGIAQASGILDDRRYVTTTFCGDETYSAEVTKDPNTGHVIKVEATYVPLMPHFARINTQSPENCIAATHKTTTEQAQKLLDTRANAIAKGKSADCDYGFTMKQCDTQVPLVGWDLCVNIGENTKAPELIPLGDATAEFGATLDIRAAQLLTAEQAEFDNNIDDELHHIAGVQPDTQFVMHQPDMSDQTIMAARLKAIEPQLKADFASYDLLTNEDGTISGIHAIGFGGEEMTLNFTGDWKFSPNTEFKLTPTGTVPVESATSASATAGSVHP